VVEESTQSVKRKIGTFPEPDFISAEVRPSDTRVYHLRWDRGGWALCTVGEAAKTGVLAIMSDWGSWLHTWHMDAIGTPVFEEFLASAGADYLACKLVPMHKRSTVDEVGTKAEFRKIVMERRRHGLLLADEARNLWDAIDRWDVDTCERDGIGPLDRWTFGPEVAKELGDVFEEPWTALKHRDSNEFEVVKHLIIPRLRDAIRARLDEFEQVPITDIPCCWADAPGDATHKAMCPRWKEIRRRQDRKRSEAR
jgi:hypothetical protein